MLAPVTDEWLLSEFNHAFLAARECKVDSLIGVLASLSHRLYLRGLFRL